MGNNEISGSVMGTTFRLSGRETIYLALLSAALFVICWLFYQSMQDMRTITITLSNQHKSIVEAQEHMTDSMDVFTYVITLPQQEREGLILKKPTRLRQMERRSAE